MHERWIQQSTKCTMPLEKKTHNWRETHRLYSLSPNIRAAFSYSYEYPSLYLGMTVGPQLEESPFIDHSFSGSRRIESQFLNVQFLEWDRVLYTRTHTVCITCSPYRVGAKGSDARQSRITPAAPHTTTDNAIICTCVHGMCCTTRFVPPNDSTRCSSVIIKVKPLYWALSESNLWLLGLIAVWNTTL